MQFLTNQVNEWYKIVNESRKWYIKRITTTIYENNFS